MSLVQDMCLANEALFEDTEIVKTEVDGTPFFEYLRNTGFPLPCLYFNFQYEVNPNSWEKTEKMLIVKLNEFGKSH